jgi:hypothetical protein
VVTNQSPDCCACCGLPPRVLTKGAFERERAFCALAKVKCGPCDMACKPTLPASDFAPECVAGQCQGRRLLVGHGGT